MLTRFAPRVPVRSLCNSCNFFILTSVILLGDIPNLKPLVVLGEAILVELLLELLLLFSITNEVLVIGHSRASARNVCLDFFG